jgi:hypothetical protein
MQEISEALEKLDELARKWQVEDDTAPRKRKAARVG